ncbi:MAG: hypothetical protein KAS17_07725 [Victivallaceae bacterium]|nr:hypothetical protein [Victivallaceae bacterium]
MKTMIKKIVLRFWPELESGTHLPQLAVVTDAPDPPTAGETHSHERPHYAVNCRLLTKNMEIDESMPILRDIPVAMTGAAAARGLAGLPGEGTIVEIAFAFGCQSKPFVRSVLPYGMDLPAIDKRSMRWQQNKTDFQEVDKDGNWTRKTSGSIFDQAQKINLTGSVEINAVAPKIYIGNGIDNALILDSSHMTAIISALDSIANHTHLPDGTVSSKDAILTQKAAIQVLKTKLDAFAKT